MENILDSLAILDCPTESEFDSILSSDDRSPMVDFQTKKGWYHLGCKSIEINGPMLGKGINVKASGDKWSAEIDTEKKTGTLLLYEGFKVSEISIS